MDSATGVLTEKTNSRVRIFRVSYWVAAGLVTLAVLGIFGSAKLFALSTSSWRVPMPLLLTATYVFLGWSAVFWGLGRRDTGQVRQRTAGLILAWSASMGILLGLLYALDRGGWIWSRLTGFDGVRGENLGDAIHLSPIEFLSRNSFFVSDPENPNHFVLPKAVYDIRETVVVPAGVTLTIEPGAVLRFRAGRSLVSYSPVQARGTAAEPIRFTAHRRWLKWGAVVVVSSERSVFEHVRFEHGRWALLDQIEFPGTLSIFGGDIEISESVFQKTYGKDAVNIREANAVIRNNLIRDAHKDGLDFDGGHGMVFGSVIIDCGDEGIDLAGDYDFQIVDNQIFDSGGGRVQADHGLEEILERNVFGYSHAN